LGSRHIQTRENSLGKFMTIKNIFIPLFTILLIFSCSNAENKNIATNKTISKKVKKSTINSKKVKVELPDEIKNIRIIRQIPHDKRLYTQGLTFHKGFLYETTGKYGSSKIVKINPEDGKIVQTRNLPFSVFGEGSTIIDGKVYVLSWREGICFVYDTESLTEVNRFSYNTEGWGLATDGKKLFMSDGGHKIRVIDPNNFRILSEIEFFNEGVPLDNLNELEYISGTLWANRWVDDNIYLLDLASGGVEQKIDMSILRKKLTDKPWAEVLNGIAYDKENGHFYFTGKNWSEIFEVVFE
jgi:glutaminyl-peptide cyclotransferase